MEGKMVVKNEIENISCEKAQGLAGFYFAGIGGDFFAGPYLKHVKECVECEKRYSQRCGDLQELGEFLGKAFYN